MRFVKIAALALGLAGGALALSGPASATPLSAGAQPLAAAESGEGLVQNAWHRGRPHGYYGRRYYRPRPIYRPYRPVYGPRCFIRRTPWGPRRVCRW